VIDRCGCLLPLDMSGARNLLKASHLSIPIPCSLALAIRVDRLPSLNSS
jgi:hypothetical protein